MLGYKRRVKEESSGLLEGKDVRKPAEQETTTSFHSSYSLPHAQRMINLLYLQTVHQWLWLRVQSYSILEEESAHE